MIKPTGSNVFVQQVERDTGPIAVPDTFKKSTWTATVVETGPDCKIAKKGDTVILPNAGKGSRYMIDDVNSLILPESEVVAFIEGAHKVEDYTDKGYT